MTVGAESNQNYNHLFTTTSSKTRWLKQTYNAYSLSQTEEKPCKGRKAVTSSKENKKKSSFPSSSLPSVRWENAVKSNGSKELQEGAKSLVYSPTDEPAQQITSTPYRETGLLGSPVSSSSVRCYLPEGFEVEKLPAGLQPFAVEACYLVHLIYHERVMKRMEPSDFIPLKKIYLEAAIPNCREMLRTALDTGFVERDFYDI
jgi:hypothetical protein